MGHSSGNVGGEPVARVLSLIDERDLASLRPALARLTAGERRAVAAAVDAWSRGLGTEGKLILEWTRSGAPGTLSWPVWRETTWPVGCVAVIGTFSEPGAAATALLRVARHTSRRQRRPVLGHLRR